MAEKPVSFLMIADEVLLLGTASWGPAIAKVGGFFWT